MQGSSREVSPPLAAAAVTPRKDMCALPTADLTIDPSPPTTQRPSGAAVPKNPPSSSSSGRPSPHPGNCTSDLVPDGSCTDGTIESRRTTRRGDDNSRDDVLDDPPAARGISATIETTVTTPPVLPAICYCCRPGEVRRRRGRGHVVQGAQDGRLHDGVGGGWQRGDGCSRLVLLRSSSSSRRSCPLLQVGWHDFSETEGGDANVHVLRQHPRLSPRTPSLPRPKRGGGGETKWPYPLRVCEMCVTDDVVSMNGRVWTCAICSVVACDEDCGVELVEATDCEEWNNAGCLECRGVENLSEMEIFRSRQNGVEDGGRGVPRATRVCVSCVELFSL